MKNIGCKEAIINNHSTIEVDADIEHKGMDDFDPAGNRPEAFLIVLVATGTIFAGLAVAIAKCPIKSFHHHFRFLKCNQKERCNGYAGYRNGLGYQTFHPTHNRHLTLVLDVSCSHLKTLENDSEQQYIAQAA